eukprot:CAMPEP_0198251466 /NCGR_PEP_ID=MMETSP1447-20131203/2291_1 /TAXON_ID=420782 /ORGANISM="Chaetoceros dichaeta, Strain CCMP1751" /LENGTH=548 /DNA_ID=CAMNT_0043936495 /DNA_START=50 /DNA_END=1696 /DNA_ORIENTATION=-
MVRHTKKDIELPKPQFQRTYIDMSTAETLAYNTLVSAVQMNLVPTSMKSKTSGFQDSLLNSKQAKYAHRALSNLRLACSGGTRVVPTLTQEHWDETLSYMKGKHGANEVELTVVGNFLHRMTTEQLSGCMVCGLQLQTLFLLPCGCQICTECVNSKTTHCPACEKGFDADDFQLLQPGLDYIWKWNIELAKKMREDAARLRQIYNEAIRQGVGENPHNMWAFGQGPDQNNNPAVIDEPPRNVHDPQQIGYPRRRINIEHQCIFPTVYTDGKCTICREIHLECNLIKEGSQCSVCHCVSEDCPKDESKAHYVTTKLLRLYITDHKGKLFPPTSSPQLGEARRLKVILFSQFRQILNVVGDRLIRSFGTGCIAEYWGKTRNKELERFSKTSDCFCMLLGKDGSHGLDLSFVTHIFFLDEILDKSLESQVVARAYRMGAKERVQVEQLVSRHSVEELIVQMNRETSVKDLYEDTNKGEKIGILKSSTPSPNSPLTKQKKERSNLAVIEKAQQQAKVHYLLSNLKLIRAGHVPLKPCLRKNEKAKRRVNFQI